MDLKKILKDDRINISAIARNIGVTPSYIAMYASGKVNIVEDTKVHRGIAEQLNDLKDFISLHTKKGKTVQGYDTMYNRSPRRLNVGY